MENPGSFTKLDDYSWRDWPQLRALQQLPQCWLGELDSDGFAEDSSKKRWFSSSKAFDEQLQQQFGSAIEWLLTLSEQKKTDLLNWFQQPSDIPAGQRLALILACDQLPRNLYRGDARAFALDGLALPMALAGIASGFTQTLAFHPRMFALMPLEHSEHIEHQRSLLSHLHQWQQQASHRERQALSGFISFAQQHHDIIARFGRFPHRNRVLGRESTAEEQVYLSAGGSRFGQ